MKIAIVGCGALGSYYGAKLCRSGHDVWFLLRSDYHHVRQYGVHIRSRDGDFHVQPRTADRPESIGPADLVLVGLKTTANAQLPKLIPPLVDSGTAVVTLQNGLGNEECLARIVPPAQLLGGLCFVCLNRIQPGLIHHIDHGRVVVGEYQGKASDQTHAIAHLFRKAGIPCDVTDDLARAHWEKLTWNIPFNGLGVGSCAGWPAVQSGSLTPGRPSSACLTTDQLLADPSWHSLVRELIGEVVAAAGALGHVLDDAIAETQVQRTLTMGAYKPSTLIDFERGQELELEALFLEPLRQAREAGVPTPRLQNLTRILQALAKCRAG
jgi:2-dehydropantoate 2-reductase